MKILVVEDDRNIRELLVTRLTGEGFKVRTGKNGTEGLAAFREQGPDLVVLDWMLPDMSGLDLLRLIRGESTAPVLFLTAKDEELDKVLALEVGADDYVTKPFGVREVIARVRSLLRRNSVRPARTRLEIGEVGIDVEQRTVSRRGKEVEMTRTEFELLLLMAQNPGIVFSRELLLQKVWGYDFEGYQRTVDSHVTRLRKKLEEDPKDPRLIVTVWGVGYRLLAPGAPVES